MTDVERAIRHARDELSAKDMELTPLRFFNSLNTDPRTAEQAIEQIRLSYGRSLVAFFQGQPSKEQLVSILDQTLQDLVLLRKKR